MSLSQWEKQELEQIEARLSAADPDLVWALSVYGALILENGRRPSPEPQHAPHLAQPDDQTPGIVGRAQRQAFTVWFQLLSVLMLAVVSFSILLSVLAR